MNHLFVHVASQLDSTVPAETAGQLGRTGREKNRTALDRTYRGPNRPACCAGLALMTNIDWDLRFRLAEKTLCTQKRKITTSCPEPKIPSSPPPPPLPSFVRPMPPASAHTTSEHTENSTVSRIAARRAQNVCGPGLGWRVKRDW
ncbi:unnamed protein product [Protopolystoma xenopodis]|uniref:Uncharacterized protein n=1 Tax=Protopolystoma xenopodis TaxID=117903 RepID=A0A3S5ARN1_9PLAT|nr:unnamed protein product [Protopolystoma xenopodis]